MWDHASDIWSLELTGSWRNRTTIPNAAPNLEKTSEKQNNQGIVLIQSKSRPQFNWNLCEIVRNPNLLKQWCKEWANRTYYVISTFPIKNVANNRSLIYVLINKTLELKEGGLSFATFTEGLLLVCCYCDKVLCELYRSMTPASWCPGVGTDASSLLLPFWPWQKPGICWHFQP